MFRGEISGLKFKIEWKMRLKKGTWSEDEKNFLRDSYGELKSKEIAEKLNRTYGSINSQIIKLGLKGAGRWAEEDGRFLKENFHIIGIDGCAEHFKKTKNAIRDKATDMGIREPIEINHWTKEEDLFIIENYTVLGVEECAKILNRTYHSVQRRATKCLGVRHYRHVPWTCEEKQFLIENYPDKLGHYCSEKLGRSFHATHKMVKKLELKPNWTYKYYDGKGYVMLCDDRDVKILEHRFLVEEFLGRKLLNEEVIHHINEIKDDNRLENLMITNHVEHGKIHGMKKEERLILENSRKLM